MPGNMHSFRLADCPELRRTIVELAALRRRFLRYFTEGEFRHTEGVRAENCLARAYSHGDDILLIVANPTAETVAAMAMVDATAWGGADVARTTILVGQDGTELDPPGPERIEVTLAPDSLVVLELTASAG
jgi:hypothetical protein